jgi:hypothetical protein
MSDLVFNADHGAHPQNARFLRTLSKCRPGYKAMNVQTNGSKLSADLVLAGKACNVYGEDIQKLKLEVQYETREHP